MGSGFGLQRWTVSSVMAFVGDGSIHHIALGVYAPKDMLNNSANTNNRDGTDSLEIRLGFLREDLVAEDNLGGR